jgi:hypothetical protein
MLRKQFRRKIKLEFTDNRAEKHQAIPSPFAPCVATTGRTRALGDDARPTRAALALPLKADLEVEPPSDACWVSAPHQATSRLSSI